MSEKTRAELEAHDREYAYGFQLGLREALNEAQQIVIKTARRKLGGRSVNLLDRVYRADRKTVAALLVAVAGATTADEVVDALDRIVPEPKYWFLVRDEVVTREDRVKVRTVVYEERVHEPAPLHEPLLEAYHDRQRRLDRGEFLNPRPRDGLDEARRAGRESYFAAATRHTRSALGELPDNFETRLRELSDDDVDELIRTMARVVSRDQAMAAIGRLLMSRGQPR